MKKQPAPTPNDRPLLAALDAAEPRPQPDGERGEKKNYAERLSRRLAELVANALRRWFPDASPFEGSGHETEFGGDSGTKRIDVSAWDRQLGLRLDVSIKTYSFRDYSPKTKKLGRFTKNLLRNDHELRAEADTIHRRQPYSVLVAIMFMPYEASSDGKTGRSSFAHAVMTFRKRTGRSDPEHSRFDRFEAVYIGLYEHEGPRRGFARFFDVTRNPPRNGHPRDDSLLTFSELISEIKHLHDVRNDLAEPDWAEPGEIDD